MRLHVVLNGGVKSGISPYKQGNFASYDACEGTSYRTPLNNVRTRLKRSDPERGSILCNR